MYRPTQLVRTAMSRTRPHFQAPASRRSFGGSILDPPGMTPQEDLLLDVSAWFVAFAMVYAPAHYHNDMDYQNSNGAEEKANHRHKKDEDQKKGH
eukprot:scaffold2644_cov129-Cylindrotheca_fusiformis.AAC.5